ncbi:MAG TPA: hypothetical protein VFB76_08690 [Candidatus Angelobacter sp.]|nr:hypothetical protein [Candidatus Angelobacter sp.]
MANSYFLITQLPNYSITNSFRSVIPRDAATTKRLQLPNGCNYQTMLQLPNDAATTNDACNYLVILSELRRSGATEEESKDPDNPSFAMQLQGVLPIQLPPNFFLTNLHS